MSGMGAAAAALEPYACRCDAGNRVSTQVDQHSLKHCLDHLAAPGFELMLLS